jgi:plastocyanin
MSSRPDLVAGVRVKIPLIVAIPIGALVVIGGAAFGFSRILLALEPEAATAIALMTAINILIACGIAAYKPRLDSVTVAELIVVMTYPILIGIVLAQIGFGGGVAHGETAAPAHATGQVLSASGVAFNTDELDFAAGKATVLTFNNENSVTHNFSIYEDETATKDLFKGAEVPAGSSTDYNIPALKKGDYYFHCDIHPAMNGTVVVK